MWTLILYPILCFSLCCIILRLENPDLLVGSIWFDFLVSVQSNNVLLLMPLALCLMRSWEAVRAAAAGERGRWATGGVGLRFVRGQMGV